MGQIVTSPLQIVDSGILWAALVEGAIGVRIGYFWECFGQC